MTNDKLNIDRRKLSIDDYLVDGEVIETKFVLNGMKMMVSNRRLFVDKRSSIRDVLYDHVASIMYKYESWNPGRVVIGLALIILSILVRAFFDEFGGGEDIGRMLVVFFLGGVTFVILGLLYKAEFMEIDVVGIKEPIIISNIGYGKVSGIEHLFRIVREKINF